MKKIYYNADVVTMDEALASAQAVVVENGKITFVGSNDDAMKHKDGAELVDLQGKALLPGFIDPHSHFSGIAFGILQVALGEAENFAEIKEKLEAHIRLNNVPEGTWIIGKGYDHNNLEEKVHPTAAFLDSFAPNHPIMLQHKSGHMGVCNSLALKELEITVDTPCREGGLIGKDENGLTGYLEEADYIENSLRTPMPSPQELFGAFIKAQARYASYGVTTAQEGLLVKQLAGLYQGLQAQNMIYLDIVSYVDCNSKEELLETFKDSVNKYNNHFKVGGVKLLLDGSPQGKTAWMLEPYAGESEYRGYPAMKEEVILKHFDFAMKNNLQVLAHCNGDAACDQFIKAVDKTSETNANTKDMRSVMIHAQLLRKEHMPRVAQAGIIPSFFVAHVYHWGDIHIQNFTKERAASISPVKTAIEHNVPYTFHQDAPIIEPNMIETLWIATNRITKKGVSLGEDQCVSVYEALKGITINAAYQYFEEATKGSITVNKNADLVVLDKNPLKVDKTLIRDIKVLETIKDGKTVYTA